MQIDSTKSKVIFYHYLCSEKIESMQAFDFYHGKYILMCRNKCNFKYDILEIRTVKRAEILCECYECIQELFVKILRHSMEKCLRARTTLNLKNNIFTHCQKLRKDVGKTISGVIGGKCLIALQPVCYLQVCNEISGCNSDDRRFDPNRSRCG